MKKYVIRIIALTFALLILPMSMVTVSAQKLYAPDGRTIDVPGYDVQSWLNVGWYDYPVVTVYSLDGRSAVISANALRAYKSVGWYEYIPVMIYAPDGRSAVIAIDALNTYKSVGWYDYPVVTIYAPDGRSVVIATDALSTYKAVGWYTQPVAVMYAPDGRSIVVGKSEVEAYEAVGWYTSKEAALPKDVIFTSYVMKEGMYEPVTMVRHHSKLGFSLEYSQEFGRSYTDNSITISWYSSVLTITKYTNLDANSKKKELLNMGYDTGDSIKIAGKTVPVLYKVRNGIVKECYLIENNGKLYVVETSCSLEASEGIGADFFKTISSIKFY